jgi:outer membrane protein assembly factor BamD (BamD/ComL family)
VALAATPDTMVRAYDEAAKAIAASDFSRAIALLKEVVQDGKDRPVQIKARTLLQELEQHAAARLVSARRLADQGLRTEAITAATEVSRTYAGSQAAKEAGPLLTAWTAPLEMPAELRSRRAKELLAQAREEYRSQQYLSCLDHCDLITSQYADLSEGPEAARMAADIKTNPEWMKMACDKMEERLALQFLALAETQLRRGQTNQAVPCLERVIQMFPGTRQAEAAQARLRQIQREPASVESKKP